MESTWVLCPATFYGGLPRKVADSIDWISTLVKNKRTQFNSLNNVLQDGQMNGLIAQASQSRWLEQKIQGWLPLRGVSFSVGPLKNGSLKLLVSSPSALTRLRQSLPSLIEHLQQSGTTVTQIQLQIQTNPLISKQLSKKPKQAVFSEAAKKAWLELEQKLDDDSPVRNATAALNRHHKFK
jgi:hypothetical protein